MNPREKKLVILLGASAFVIVNAALFFKVYEPAKKNAEREIRSHAVTIKSGSQFLDMRDQYADEIKWLEKNIPETADYEKVRDGLLRFAKTEASRNGLTIKREKFLDPIQDPAAWYSRARVELEVSGREDVLYRWLDRLQTPAEFRGLTALDMSPEREDDTLIVCKVVVEQWFVPEDPAAAEATETASIPGPRRIPR